MRSSDHRDSNQYLYQVKLRWEQIQAQAAWLPDLTGLVDRLLAYVKARSRSDGFLARSWLSQ